MQHALTICYIDITEWYVHSMFACYIDWRTDYTVILSKIVITVSSHRERTWLLPSRQTRKQWQGVGQQTKTSWAVFIHHTRAVRTTTRLDTISNNPQPTLVLYTTKTNNWKKWVCVHIHLKINLNITGFMLFFSLCEQNGSLSAV